MNSNAADIALRLNIITLMFLGLILSELWKTKTKKKKKKIWVFITDVSVYNLSEINLKLYALLMPCVYSVTKHVNWVSHELKEMKVLRFQTYFILVNGGNKTQKHH